MGPFFTGGVGMVVYFHEWWFGEDLKVANLVHDFE